MDKLYSTTQVAALLEKATVTVRKAARVHGIGVQVGRDRAFTAEDIEQLQKVIHDRSGRPKRTALTSDNLPPEQG
jgi:hypothetical protein